MVLGKTTTSKTQIYYTTKQENPKNNSVCVNVNVKSKTLSLFMS